MAQAQEVVRRYQSQPRWLVRMPDGVSMVHRHAEKTCGMGLNKGKYLIHTLW
jgi:hypothetical protein